ncbi:MAG: M48 family metalloprotease, partial [Kofleriaceae bacterium]
MIRAWIAVLAGCGAASCAAPRPYLGADVPDACTRRDVEACLGWMMERDLQAAELGVYDDPALRRYVQRVLDRLARFARLDAPAPRVVLADQDDTYATAGRRIVIARSTLERLSTEAELAAILAHELAHLEARHVRVSLFGDPDDAGAQLDRRDAEAIADERAVWLVERAGYAPSAVARALDAVLAPDDPDVDPEVAANVAAERAHELDSERAHDIDSDRAPDRGSERAPDRGRERAPARGSSRASDRAPARDSDLHSDRAPLAAPEADPRAEADHPPRADRIARVSALAGGRTGVENRDELLRQLDGMVIGRDPRRGQRIGDAWVVPALGLAIELGEGDAVRAVDHALVVRRGRGSMVAYTIGAPWARELAALLDDRETVDAEIGRITAGRTPR